MKLRVYCYASSSVSGAYIRDTSYHKKIINGICNEFVHSIPDNKLYNTIDMKLCVFMCRYKC